MQSVVLIGPYGIGKSTVGRLLADAWNMRQYALDDVTYRYCQEAGMTDELAQTLDLLAPEWQPYHAHAVKRFLDDHRGEPCILDFGAGHSLYDGSHFTEVKQALGPFVVVLLLPSPDPDEALHDLTTRNNAHFYKRTQPHAQWTKLFLEHPSPYALATHTVYTKGKTAKQVADEIIALVQSG
jgi:adenylate kinase family enzyme